MPLGNSREERSVLAAILRRFSRGRLRLYRNTVGAIRAQSGQFVRYGLGAGTPDIIGWKQVEITPEMVGKTLAVFVGIEIKRPGEKPTPAQEQFLSVLKAFGGIAGWADSEEGAAHLLGESFDRAPHRPYTKEKGIRPEGPGGAGVSPF